jgi:uncharacterized protein YbjT (DUF2867 family)
MSSTRTGEILVLGASGKTGRLVAERLTALGHSVRAASRSSAIRFDWDDTSTWTPALAGVDAVFFVPTETLGLAERTAFVDQAKAAGVRRIVQLSVRGVAPEGGFHPTEEAVTRSGLEWTLLRPCWFNQDFAAPDFFLTEVLAGELATPAGEGREPFIDAADIAAVAVAALTEEGHAGRAYDLSGPEALTFAEALDVIGAATGRTLRHRHIGGAEYREVLIAAGASADDARSIADFLEGVAKGTDAYLSTGVQEVLGREPRTFESYVRATAPTGVWTPDGR